MKIQYLGHSSFLLAFEGGTRIVTDPFGDVGIPMPHVAADAVTVSHAHYDHNNVSAISSPLVLQRAGEYEVGGVRIEAVRRFHDDAGGRKRGETLVFRFEGEGLTLLHFGDIGEPCTKELAASFGKADVVFLPVGGNYTIDARGAKSYAEAFYPAAVIPMHYKVKGLTVDIAGAEPFLALMGGAERVGDTLTIEAHTPFAGKVFYMERR